MRNRSVVLLFAAMLLIGVAQLLVLPPFEGFDETAHYSYVREIADTQAIPIFGRSTIASIVADYRRSGPMPYTSVVPFNENGGWTYDTFAAAPGHHDAYRQQYRSAESAPRRFAPTSELNWETQHPPLYYALLAPVMRATDHLSFNAQLLLLRLVSYVFASIGMLIALHGTLNYLAANDDSRRAFIAGALLYPFLVPMFLPEFARLGNDSLCTLLVGLSWVTLLAVAADSQRKTAAVLLGLVIGLGLLTKAFFLPIGTGVGAYLLYRSFAVRHERVLARTRFQHALIVISVALMTGGWWYVYKFLAFNSITGGAELINLDAQGGLLANLQQKFALGYLVRGLAALIATAYYTSTWSLTRLHETLYLPGLFLLALIAVRSLGRLRRLPLTAPEWAPIWMAAPVVAGFVYFILARIALTESGNNIGGWYFNVLAPVVAVMFGLGVNDLPASRAARRIAVALSVYAWLFFIAGQWAQTSLYAGCAIKTADSKYYVFRSGGYCLDRVPDIFRNLAVIGWPLAAAACFTTGTLCLGMGLRSLTNRQRLEV